MLDFLELGFNNSDKTIERNTFVRMVMVLTNQWLDLLLCNFFELFGE